MTVLARLTPGNFFRFSSSHQVSALREELERFAQARPEARAMVPADLSASSIDDIGELLDLRRRCEHDWGAPVTELDLRRLRGGELFAVHKALVLSRLGRHPREVTEGFVTGSGRVGDVRIEPRDIFWQRFLPIGAPNGRVVVLSPRYGETGRDYADAIDAMARQGFDVFVMDHQWAGHTTRSPDGVDSGFGVSRDVAAVGAFAASVMEREYQEFPDRKLILVGKALGASAGAFSTALLNDHGLLKLDGREMPKGVDLVMVSPWFGPTSSFQNKVRRVASRIPFIRRLSIQYNESTGLRLDSPRAMRSLLAALRRARKDLQVTLDLLEDGKTIDGRAYIIHNSRDPVASPDLSLRVARQMKDRAILRLVDTRYSETQRPGFMSNYVVDGLNSLVVQASRER